MAAHLFMLPRSLVGCFVSMCACVLLLRFGSTDTALSSPFLLTLEMMAILIDRYKT